MYSIMYLNRYLIIRAHFSAKRQRSARPNYVADYVHNQGAKNKWPPNQAAIYLAIYFRDFIASFAKENKRSRILFISEQ